MDQQFVNRFYRVNSDTSNESSQLCRRILCLLLKKIRRRNYVFLSAILWRIDRERREDGVIKQSHARLLLGRQMFRKRPVISGAYGRTSGKISASIVDFRHRFSFDRSSKSSSISNFHLFVYAESLRKHVVFDPKGFESIAQN